MGRGNPQTITLVLKSVACINYSKLETSKPSINVIVNCSARKIGQIPDELCLRALGKSSPKKRAQLWASRLFTWPSKPSPAEQIYCGDAWSIARAATASYQYGKLVHLWVASAGYGLIHASEPIHPYSATFTLRQDDSVSLTGEKKDCVQWWTGLCESAKSANRTPHSIESLAMQYPSTPLLVALSPDYLAAAGSDLEAACSQITDPDLLVIVSAGSQKNGNFAKHLLPCDARLEHQLGGARTSLNSRIIRHILETTKPENIRYSFLSEKLAALLQLQPEHRSFNRFKASDLQVEEFITRHLQANPILTHTALLRQFRDNNQACEQKRFGQIFVSVRNAILPSK